MSKIDLIYCAAGNKRFAEIAISNGWHYGAQLPNSVYFHPYFVDQDWRDPDLSKYVKSVAAAKPHMATIIDYEKHIPFATIIEWAESIAPYVDVIIVIPKVIGSIDCIPDAIGDKPIRLGYSVPTSYGGTLVPYSEFGRREVHLLGGSPNKQMRLSKYLNVISIDGNYMQKMAVKYCQFWSPGNIKAKNRWWPQLQEVNGYVENDAPYVAFEMSAKNLMQAWGQLDDYSNLPLFGGF